MKLTKEMQAILNGEIANETVESRELYLCMDNESKLSTMRECIIKNLAKKFKKGIYDKEKAYIAFYHLADAMNVLYKKDFGYNFNTADRFRASIEMAESIDLTEYI